MRKGVFARLFILFYLVFTLFSIIFTQVIPFLNHRGFSETQTSWVLSISAVIGMVLQLLIGYWSDKYQKTKFFFIIVIISLSLISGLAFYLTNLDAWFIFLLCSLFIALYRVSNNVTETWAYQIDDEVTQQFGLIRIFGSLGWASASIVIAKVIEMYDYPLLLPIIMILTVLILLVSFGVPDSSKISNQPHLSMKDIKILFTNKQYVLGLWIFFILFIIFNVDGITVIYKMIELGSSNGLIGVKWFAQAISEIPLMILGSRLIMKFSNKSVTRFTSIFMALRFILYGLATSAQQMVIITLLQAVTFPTLLIGQKDFVAKTTPIELRSSGHLLMTAITSNIPVILVPIMTNLVSSFMNNSQILLACGIVSLLPLLILKDVEI